MERSSTGFLRPVEIGTATPEQDRTISQLCPGIRLDLAPDKRDTHAYWGPHVAVRTGWAADPALRFEASSGGALSATLCHMLQTGEVDAIVQITADTEDPTANRTVVSTTPEEVANASGSRYAPSAPLEVVPSLLNDERQFAFVGKPCDVAAMAALREIVPQVRARFPVLISFFCAGVPSLEGGDALLDRMGVHKADVATFRYRGRGWPGCARATSRDGSERTLSYEESWGAVLSGKVQLRCRICPDGTGHFADLVFADAWATDARGYPLFSEQEGISLILSRTVKGEDLLSQAISTGDVHARPFDIGGIAAMQPGQVSKRQLALARLFALRCVGHFTPRFTGFPLRRNARDARTSTFLRNVLGTILRRARNRLRA